MLLTNATVFGSGRCAAAFYLERSQENARRWADRGGVVGHPEIGFVNASNDLAARANYYARTADEFLRVYFVLGLNDVLMHARYFVMAHCLELSFKASLANQAVEIQYNTHRLDTLEELFTRHCTPDLLAFRPSDEARQVFKRMFGPAVVNFDMTDWLNHRDALEVLLCYEHGADLKYGIDRDGGHILAVTPSTERLNKLFLRYVACARALFPSEALKDSDIVDFVRASAQQYPEFFEGAPEILQ